MSDIIMKTNEPKEVGDNYIIFSGEVEEFDQDKFQAVLCYFEYSGDPNFEAGVTRTPVEENKAVMENGGEFECKTHKGLLGNKNYHYRAVGVGLDFNNPFQALKGVYSVPHEADAMEAVANNETAMEAVANSETAMEALANNETAMEAVANNETTMETVANSETAMEAVANSETAMEAVINSVIGRTGMLLSSHVVDTMWSNQMASEKFWNPTLPYTVTEGRTIAQSFQVDLTNISKLHFNIRGRGNSDWWQFRVYIDNEIEYHTSANHSSGSDIEIQTSGYNGIKTIKMEADRGADSAPYVGELYKYNTVYYLRFFEIGNEGSRDYSIGKIRLEK